MSPSDILCQIRLIVIIIIIIMIIMKMIIMLWFYMTRSQAHIQTTLFSTKCKDAISHFVLILILLVIIVPSQRHFFLFQKDWQTYVFIWYIVSNTSNNDFNNNNDNNENDNNALILNDQVSGSHSNYIVLYNMQGCNIAKCCTILTSSNAFHRSSSAYSSKGSRFFLSVPLNRTGSWNKTKLVMSELHEQATVSNDQVSLRLKSHCRTHYHLKIYVAIKSLMKYK